MSVYRIYVEKKPEFAVEADSLISGIKSALGLDNLKSLRVINRYDAEGLSADDFKLAVPVVFSEPAVDVTYDHLPDTASDEYVFAVEYLPGQFDQRADSCAQCISLLTGGKRPTVKSARIYIAKGNLSENELKEIKSYMINPVESREATLDTMKIPPAIVNGNMLETPFIRCLYIFLPKLSLSPESCDSPAPPAWW